MITLDFWFLFPLGILIAILGMSSGISGSNFWIPVYIIWLKIDPKAGFWLALLTMILGFGSGVIKNLHEKTVNWYLVRQYLKICIPASVFGALLSAKAPANVVLAAFGGFVTIYGAYRIHQFFTPSVNTGNAHNTINWLVGGVAGFLIGLIATGLGKLILPALINHNKIKHHAEAVGTTVVIVFIVNFAALVSRMDASLLQTLLEEKDFILSIILWVAPGVVIGGQLGPVVAQKLPKAYLGVYVGGLLVLVGGLIFYRVLS